MTDRLRETIGKRLEITNLRKYKELRTGFKYSYDVMMLSVTITPLSYQTSTYKVHAQLANGLCAKLMAVEGKS